MDHVGNHVVCHHECHRLDQSNGVAVSTDIRNQIIANLRQVYDPEISTNIYDLGLIYKIDLEQLPKVMIEMTLTSAWCPSADDIIRETELAAVVDGVDVCEVKIVWTPQWGPHMMSEEAQLELNMMQAFEDTHGWGPPY
jgi:metal-sulfur cluster biosynthetic enzyme